MIVAAVIGLSASLIIFSYILTKYFNYRKKCELMSKLPGLQPHRILGDIPYMIGRVGVQGLDMSVVTLQSIGGLCSIFREEGICRIWIAYDAYVVTFSAKTVEPILTSHVEIDKAAFYDLLHPWLGTGLLTSTGKKWKTRRKLLTPTFHYRILDEFNPIFDQGSKIFVQKLQTFINEDWVDVVPLVTRCSLDIICETAMGVKLNSQMGKANDYVEAVKTLADIFLFRSMKPWLGNDIIFSLTSMNKQWKKALKTLHSFTKEIVKQRKVEIIKNEQKDKEQETLNDNNNLYRKQRKAFLDLLLQQQFENNSLSDNDICEEVDTFMFEGHDTTSVGIVWALYHLGCYPYIQQKMYEELSIIFGEDKDRPITIEDLREMKYLECVLKETQRLTPSVPIFSRNLINDVKIGEYTAPRGSNNTVFVYELHRDPKVYPNPEVFDPDRFLPENCIGRHPFAYIPFSAGPRNCIGQKFAMMEMKIVICNVVRNFFLESIDPPDKVLKSLTLVLKPKDRVRLSIKKRT